MNNENELDFEHSVLPRSALFTPLLFSILLSLLFPSLSLCNYIYLPILSVLNTRYSPFWTSVPVTRGEQAASSLLFFSLLIRSSKDQWSISVPFLDSIIRLFYSRTNRWSPLHPDSTGRAPVLGTTPVIGIDPNFGTAYYTATVRIIRSQFQSPIYPHTQLQSISAILHWSRSL